MTQESLFRQVLNPVNRPNPYPIYAQLREQPVALQEDGAYVISTYKHVSTLLHDPRISSDMRKSDQGARIPAPQDGREVPEPPFLFLDPPNHDRLRRLVVNKFTPAQVEGLREQIVQTVKRHLDALDQKKQFDVVDDLAYPLPVTVICEMLGVPSEDEQRFHEWADILASALDPGQNTTEEGQKRFMEAMDQMRQYMIALLAARREHPSDDLLSELITGNTPSEYMTDQELISTAVLLLIAGHETTVNLITNGMLTLLRNPDVLERLRQDPELVVGIVEEVLRYDPPVQFRLRTTLTDIEVAGTTIPKGATIVLVLASGSRDPERFPHADRFDPEREDNQHLGFGGGIHYCVGAPLARLEAQIVLAELARRLENPRLAIDPPHYRDNAALRGPEHLLVNFDGLKETGPTTLVHEVQSSF